MKGKFTIDDKRIDGIQLLGMKFPSLTSRQIWKLYELASKQGLSLEDIKGVQIGNPMADIGEDFDMTIDINL